LALPRASLEFIDWKPFKTDKDLKEKLKSVIKQASIKIILEYNHAWWLSLGRVYGRSLTDLPIRQTMYFTSDSEAQEFEEELKTDSLVTKTSTKPAVLMASYNDIETVPFWKGFQKDGCDFPGDEYAATESMVKEAHRQVAEMHGQRALPDPISAKYFDWTQEPFGAAWHCWKPNYNYKDIMQSILHPVAGENIFICGEAYSNDQGWAEGALETAELVLTKKLKIKELLPQKSTTRGLSEKKVFGYQPDLLRRLRY
jgi:monoamine oxidase